MALSRSYEKGRGHCLFPPNYVAPKIPYRWAVEFELHDKKCCLIGDMEFALDFRASLVAAGEYAGLGEKIIMVPCDKAHYRRRDETLKYFSRKIKGGWGEGIGSIFRQRLYNTDGLELPSNSVLRAI